MSTDIQLKKYLWRLLLAALVLRLLAMWLIPLTDTTEARYGEISRKMLETNNWVSPLHDYKVDRKTCEEIACIDLGQQNAAGEKLYGVPFWAKPPLSTWSSAASMKLFGVNEFAARLPTLLFSIGILWLIFNWLKLRENHFNLIAITTLATSLLFFMSSATVMTDLALLFCSTLAMVSFWQAVVVNENKIWGYLFFVSLGLGLLAKGPLILVLVGLPTGLWTLVHGQLLTQWKRLPWITGIVLMLAIAGPWYYLAEKSTPGFFEYFIVGEHYNRFMVSGWDGDKYGHAHSEPLGIIWLMLFAGFLPWSILAIYAFIKNRNTQTLSNPFKKQWLSYLCLWSVMPVIFFTFAHNIIAPYALPAMPAGAILISELLIRFCKKDQTFNLKVFSYYATSILVILGIALFVFTAWPQKLAKRSEKEMIAVFEKAKSNQSAQLYYLKERLYSAEFYSGGTAKILANISELKLLANNNQIDFVAVNQRWVDADANEYLQAHFKKITELHRIRLYEECPTELACEQH